MILTIRTHKIKRKTLKVWGGVMLSFYLWSKVLTGIDWYWRKLRNSSFQRTIIITDLILFVCNPDSSCQILSASIFWLSNSSPRNLFYILGVCRCMYKDIHCGMFFFILSRGFLLIFKKEEERNTEPNQFQQPSHF